MRQSQGGFAAGNTFGSATVTQPKYRQVAILLKLAVFAVVYRNTVINLSI